MVRGAASSEHHLLLNLFVVRIVLFGFARNSTHLYITLIPSSNYLPLIFHQPPFNRKHSHITLQIHNHNQRLS
ncbi:hypothetical protein RIF29_26082 [Crotalaria pallida]|uniref:Uncharacterized protein n=1 Tax=Crotalaria pallida TaxID=3830 RepID=A0AAN9EPR2_CROPI